VNGSNFDSEEFERLILVNKQEVAQNGDYNLSGERYSITFSIASDYKTVSLDELCEFRNGLWKSDREPLVRAQVIRNTNFRQDGFIDWSDIAELDVEERQLLTRELEYGDIIIEKSGGGPTQPVGRVVYFNKREKGFSFSNFTSLI